MVHTHLTVQKVAKHGTHTPHCAEGG